MGWEMRQQKRRVSQLSTAANVQLVQDETKAAWMLHEASVSVSAQRNAMEISDKCEASAKAEHTESQDHAFRVYQTKDYKLAQQAIENSQLSLKLAEMESAAMIKSETSTEKTFYDKNKFEPSTSFDQTKIFPQSYMKDNRCLNDTKL